MRYNIKYEVQCLDDSGNVQSGIGGSSIAITENELARAIVNITTQIDEMIAENESSKNNLAVDYNQQYY